MSSGGGGGFYGDFVPSEAHSGAGALGNLLKRIAGGTSPEAPSTTGSTLGQQQATAATIVGDTAVDDDSKTLIIRRRYLSESVPDSFGLRLSDQNEVLDVQAGKLAGAAGVTTGQVLLYVNGVLVETKDAFYKECAKTVDVTIRAYDARGIEELAARYLDDHSNSLNFDELLKTVPRYSFLSLMHPLHLHWKRRLQAAQETKEALGMLEMELEADAKKKEEEEQEEALRLLGEVEEQADDEKRKAQSPMPPGGAEQKLRTVLTASPEPPAEGAGKVTSKISTAAAIFQPGGAEENDHPQEEGNGTHQPEGEGADRSHEQQQAGVPSETADSRGTVPAPEQQQVPQVQVDGVPHQQGTASAGIEEDVTDDQLLALIGVEVDSSLPSVTVSSSVPVTVLPPPHLPLPTSTAPPVAAVSNPLAPIDRALTECRKWHCAKPLPPETPPPLVGKRYQQALSTHAVPSKLTCFICQLQGDHFPEMCPRRGETLLTAKDNDRAEARGEVRAQVGELCRRFLQGKCYEGSACKYVHPTKQNEDGGYERDVHVPMPRKVKQVCHRYMRGNCLEGEYCKFVHPPQAGADDGSPRSTKEICRRYSRGHCPEGSRCPYLHSDSHPEERTPPSSRRRPRHDDEYDDHRRHGRDRERERSPPHRRHEREHSGRRGESPRRREESPRRREESPRRKERGRDEQRRGDRRRRSPPRRTPSPPRRRPRR